MQCGLLGRKLGHSYSPQIHSQLGSYDYRLFEKEPEELEDFLKNGDFTGLNVTIPYKKDVIPFLDELSPRAKALGAVNTIVRRNGKLLVDPVDLFQDSRPVLLDHVRHDHREFVAADAADLQEDADHEET